MSDYNPTYTVQWRDYAAQRRERERTGNLFVKAPLITEERPNPLSMELRIVFDYLWDMYKDCLECARLARESEAGVYLGSTAASYVRDAKEAVAYASLLCHELFDVTSPHAPVHIHSEYGCNDEDCPAWKRGYEAAQENVLDWYSPD